MKKKDVEVGGIYLAKVSNRLVKVRIDREAGRGWYGTNLRTRREVRILSAQRLRRRIDAPRTDATPTNVVAQVATEPAVQADGAEERGDAALPTVVARVEPQIGQEGDESMGKKQSQKQGEKVAKKAKKGSAAKAAANGTEKGAVRKAYEAPAQGVCPACKRTVELPDHKGRCECGQALLARGGRLVRIKETPRGCLDMLAAKTLAEPPKEEPAKAEKPRRQKADGKMSGLDAAAKVLAEAGEPLGCDEVVKRMLDQGLWATGGKTPAATIYAAIIREIAKKGEASRFRKVERGQFTVAK